jgi:glycerol-3-phosphate acyltransferase PlsY
MTPEFWLAVAAGYLMGAVPFGLLLTKAAGMGDIRAIGSGNIGATNVLRTGKKGLAAATLLLDGGKGAVAALVAGFLISPAAGMAAGLAAVFGHNFPIWLRFKGGKGVATSLGVLLATAWPVGVGACLTWLLVAAVTRYSSLSAIIALLAAPLYALVLGNYPMAVMAACLGLLGAVRHRANILRLANGSEPKIGMKRTSPS